MSLDVIDRLKKICSLFENARFRHDSIPTAIDTLQGQGANNNITFDATEDPTQFTNTSLARYDAVLFLNTTDGTNGEEVHDSNGKHAFQTYLNNGGNFVGIHAATQALQKAPFFWERSRFALQDKVPCWIFL